MAAFPYYHQMDSMDCGPTCLKIIAKFYGKNHSFQSLREKCHITNAGVSLAGIAEAAENIGFRTISLKIKWEVFRDEIPLPCIVYWQQAHL